jgi:hypothetical protein
MIWGEVKLDASAAQIDADTTAVSSGKARLCFWVLLNQQIDTLLDALDEKIANGHET